MGVSSRLHHSCAPFVNWALRHPMGCLLYTSDAADEGLGVDLGGRRIIKKKNSDVVQ